MPTPIAEIRRQIEVLEKQAQALRKEVAAMGEEENPDDLLSYLGEPLSFQQLMVRSGFKANDLRERLTRLYVSRRIERWDLPRFVRSDLGTNEKKALLRQILTETPVRQKGGEALTGLTRGQVSGVFIELQKEGGPFARLGSTKGDPWFLSRGTLPPPIAEQNETVAPVSLPRRRGKHAVSPAVQASADQSPPRQRRRGSGGRGRAPSQ